MIKEEKNKLLSKISRLYYIGNLTQQEIADKLNISRTKVSRYLDKAREEKIVEIKINSPRENYEELEYVIEKRYKINECIVVPTYENREEILKEMAKELGNIFERILNDGDYLGIGWGTSLKSVADYLDIDRKAHIRVVPIIGGLGKVGTGIHTNSVARAVADKLGGISYMIHCPAVMDSKEAKEIIENDSNTKEIIEMSDKIDAAMVGMGDISPESTLVKTGNFSIEEFDYLSSLGVAGDINLTFINEDGEHVISKMDDRIIRISTDKIKKIKNVIGVGFGDRKVKVIIGALRGKFVNILLTDEKTAKKIIVEGWEVINGKKCKGGKIKYTNINGCKIEDKFKDLENSIKIEMLKKMYQIRHFENETEQFIIRGEIHGTCHLYVGEEATAVGTIYAIKSDDYITSTHRGHGHCIAKGADLSKMMAELLGKSTGYCKGKGGSMHIADIDTGNLGANGVVGGGFGIATGAALTCKLKERKKMVVCFFGDGATNRGIFHETVNIASIWNLPIIYLCENNVYGMSMPVKEAFNIKRISDRKASYGIEGITIDGNSIAEVFNTVSYFASKCRAGSGPVLVECLTYRWKGHSKSDAQVYRTKEEVKQWMGKDPIERYKKVLMEDAVITEKEDKDLEKEVISELKEAVKFAKDSPFPDVLEVEDDVYV